MKVEYFVSGDERKRLVKVIEGVTGKKAVYKFMPTCNFEIGEFTVLKDGTLEIAPNADETTVKAVLNELKNAGFKGEKSAAKTQVEIPIENFPGDTLKNLWRIVESKEKLIKKAIGTDCLPIIEGDSVVCFPWFFDTDEFSTSTYTEFIFKLCQMARDAKCIRVKERKVENEKYAFRCFLLRLGYIGDEYKEKRKLLLKNFTGSGAFKKVKDEKEE